MKEQLKVCKICFMNEGNRCYAEPVNREKDGRSKKIVNPTDICDVNQFKSVYSFYNLFKNSTSNKKIK